MSQSDKVCPSCGFNASSLREHDNKIAEIVRVELLAPGLCPKRHPKMFWKGVSSNPAEQFSSGYCSLCAEMDEFLTPGPCSKEHPKMFWNINQPGFEGGKLHCSLCAEIAELKAQCAAVLEAILGKETKE